MFGFQKKRKRLGVTISLITGGGHEVSTRFKDEKYLQWEHAQLWTSFCGTIPALAFVITHELFKNSSPSLKMAQHAFISATEEALFNIYRQYAKGKTVRIRDCLPLASERLEVCRTCGTSEDTYVTMDMILGIIFPKRLHNYQIDWAAGFTSGRLDALTPYSAMRLAADISGVQTPQSLVGKTARELGITGYDLALSALIEFVSAYFAMNPND